MTIPLDMILCALDSKEKGFKMEIDVYDKKFVIKSYDDELTLTIDILRNLLTAFNVEIEEVEDE